MEILDLASLDHEVSINTIGGQTVPSCHREGEGGDDHSRRGGGPQTS